MYHKTQTGFKIWECRWIVPQTSNCEHCDRKDMNETKSKDEDLSLRSINISDHDDPKMTDNGLTIKKMMS